MNALSYDFKKWPLDLSVSLQRKYQKAFKQSVPFVC